MCARRLYQVLAAIALAPLATCVLTGGCADDATLSSLLDTLTTGPSTAQVDQQTSTTDATADVNAGASTQPDSSTQMPPGPPPWAGMGCRGPQLTEEQQAALADLKAALDAGDITQDEFCQQLHDLLGDPPCGPPLPPIDLTEDQIAQAETIFQQAHDQIVSLATTARDDVLAQLTADQQQALTDLEQQNAPPEDANMPAPLCPPAENSACSPPPDVPLPPCPSQDSPPWGPPPGGMPHGFMRAGVLQQPHMGPSARGPHPLCLSEDVIAALSLTEEQVTAITGIHDTLRSAIQQVQDDAQQAFEALLTEEQLAQLDQLPPPPPWAPGPPPRQ